MSRRKGVRRIIARKQEAIDRQEARDKRSNAEQVQILDQRLGAGVGATVERLRLRGEIKEKKKVEVIEPKAEKKEPKFKAKKGQDPIKEKKKFKKKGREKNK